MNTPIRKYQQEKDYQRHKLFRKMKRRRKAQIESAKDAPVRALRRKLGIPKFAEGKNASRTLQFVGDDGRILDDLGDDMMVLYDESDGYGDDPANWVYVNDRTGETYVPNIRANNGTIQSKGDWSGLSRLAALSNAYRNNPILGAPARLYDSWNNAMDNSIGINPLDIAGLVATLAGASSIRRPLTPKQLSKMSLQELGNYFKANPQLLRDIEVTDNVRKFYNNDVLPRLAKQNKKPLGFTADDLINSLNFKAGNFDKNRYGGYYSSGDNAIVLNDRVLNDPRLLDRVLMHEISHGMYNRAGYTPEVASRLNTTYQFSPEYLAAHPGLQQLSEQAAVNTETRGMISMDNGWVAGRALDGIVKNMDPFNLMRYFNGPGSSTYAKDWTKRFLPGLALQRATLSAVANPKDTVAALPKDSIGYKNGKSPNRDGIPYDDDRHNLEYDHARAAQLGYLPDKNGHYSTRDYETGRYLKSPIHPTVMKGIVSDLGMGYIPYYNPTDGQLYSDTWMKPYKEEQIPIPYRYKNGKLPGYKSGDKPITVGEYKVYPWITMGYHEENTDNEV